jgi:hypothetical protein
MYGQSGHEPGVPGGVETGVAVASFYPDVSLSRQLGTEALSSANAWVWPSRAVEIGPAMSISIFEGGRLKGMLRLASRNNVKQLSVSKKLCSAHGGRPTTPRFLAASCDVKGIGLKNCPEFIRE